MPWLSPCELVSGEGERWKDGHTLVEMERQDVLLHVLNFVALGRSNKLPLEI